MYSPCLRNAALCLAVVLCILWPLSTVTGTLTYNNLPAVKEFGVADNALNLCFDKTVYALSRSPASEVHTTDKNINYVRVETLHPKYGGVNAEITSGALKSANIVITLTEGSKKPLFKSNVRIQMYCVA